MTSTTLNAGTYYLYAVLEATDNYQGVVTEVTEYRVEPRTAELSWEPTKFIYNGKEQAPTATVTNRVGNDICIVTVSGGQIDANTVNVPEYTAVAEKLSNPNYVLPSNGAATHFTIAKAQQEAPIVGGVSETILGKEDGRISNLNSDMEIRAEDATNYTKIMATDVTFAPGIYYVRYAEKTNYDASAETRIIIGEGRMLQISLPASQMGYEITTQDRKLSWHGTTKLNFKLQPGYSKTDSFAVKVNGKAVELTDDQYVIRAAEDDQVITVEGVADITAPEGQITIAGNNWKEMLNTISFGLFFKEKQDVTITAVDAGSGVKEIDYYVSEKELDSTTVQQVAAWQIYTEKFSIAPNHGYIVYARLTDYAGNIKYLSSDGVVLYTDAETVTPAIDYYKASGENKTARVSLNDNTIREVRDADKVLQEGTDYTISASGDEIIFKNSYLQSLAADNIPYIIYISYYPLGKEYVEGIHNQAPKQTTVQLTISRQTGSITGIGNLTKIYDGEAVTEPTYKANTDASVTVEYKAKDAEDTAYTTVAPVNVGEYTVRLSASETENYTAATVTQNFRIVARELTVQVIAQNKEYDGTVAAEVSATVETGVKDQSISVNGITGTFKDSNAGQNKEVMLDSSKVSISSDNEGTLLANYKISYPVTAKADITQAHLIILPTQAQKTYGEADPQIGYQVIGWKQKEQPEGILIGSLSRETGENVGTYRYTLGSLKDRNDNYKLQLAEGDEVPVFAIVQKTITEDKISIGTDENGKVQVIIRDLVVDGNKTLKEDIDYTVVRSDTEKVETIVIKGKGNYQFEITKKVAKPEWKGNIATTVVTEPEVEKIAPALEPVAERNAKQTLVNIVKDDTLKKRLENITPDLNYNVLMYLEVKQADSKIEPEEKKLIADSIRESEQLPVGTVVGKYMDLALYMTYTVSNDAGVLESGTEKITNTSDEKMGTGKGYKQIIRFTIPEELRNSDSRMERTYYIIRVHEENGTTNVDVLNTVREGNVLSFETDKFSTYVIAYADQKKQEKADDSDKDDNISDARVVAQNSQAVSAPKTGDNSHMVVWITLFLLSAGGMTGVVAVNYRKRKKSAK